jgi:hypothetical protein
MQALEKQSASLREDLQLTVEREKAASEERGRSSVLLQAEREKGALQEQLTFLKVQLQYALKVLLTGQLCSYRCMKHDGS